MNLAEISESYSSLMEKREFIPDLYSRDEFDVSELPELGSTSWFQRSSLTTPMWEFSHHNKKVLSLKPVSIQITKGEKLFFAENDNLAIYATGETPPKAINAFCEELIYFYHHYKKLSWNQVTGEAKKLKIIYEDIFA